MKQAFVILTVLAVSLFGAEKKKKPPDLTIVETSARRSEGKIALDGRVRNSGERPIQGLVLLFDFLAPGSLVITTQRTEIDEEVLERGQECAFHVEMIDPVRAVHYQFNAKDRSERELTVANAGPFPID